eukprot:scaffold63052_cov66-Phaeocystis_antarctica.AAC.1
MYVSACIAWWRPGGSTCLSAAAVAMRGRTGSTDTGATQPRRSRRGGAGGGGAACARRPKGLFEGTLRRDAEDKHSRALHCCRVLLTSYLGGGLHLTEGKRVSTTDHPHCSQHHN